MKAYWELQYAMVKDARTVLLDYCAGIAPLHFMQKVAGFGHDGSIRNLFVHIVSTYQAWLGERALQRKITFPVSGDITTVHECRLLFRQVDELVATFTDRFSEIPLTELAVTRQNVAMRLTPLQLFTHVITHEFHHKGQILSISRQLGYIPADTDIIR